MGHMANLGVRVLAAVLKAEGFQVRQIFLPRERYFFPDFGEPYPPQVLRSVAQLCRDADLVGLTVMSSYLRDACDLTRAIRQCSSAPIIWGGIHPTVRPEECLQHADMVCRGEGEDALLELAQRLRDGRGPLGVDNILVRQGDRIHRMPLRPLRQDIDSLPFADLSVEDSYALVWGELLPMDERLRYERYVCTARSTRYLLGSSFAYNTIASRGCRFACSYCGVPSWRREYGKGYRVRRRSTENIIQELELARQRIPQLSGITFGDDLFLGGRKDQISEFCQAYGKRIGLPFFALFAPSQIDERTMASLAAAGLRVAEMGIQTGSARIAKLYRRNCFKREMILDAAQAMNRYAPQVVPRYDIILDNPEEKTEDLRDTLELLTRLPKPNVMTFFSLTVFPGTELWERAEQASRREGADGRYYFAKEASYYHLLGRLLAKGAPRRLIRLLGSAPVGRLATGRAMHRLYDRPYKMGMEGSLHLAEARERRKRKRESEAILAGRRPA